MLPIFILRSYSIILQITIATKLDCNVSPKGCLKGIIDICTSIFKLNKHSVVQALLWNLQGIPHPFFAVLAPGQSDTLFWSRVIFHGVSHKSEEKIITN